MSPSASKGAMLVFDRPVRLELVGSQLLPATRRRSGDSKAAWRLGSRTSLGTARKLSGTWQGFAPNHQRTRLVRINAPWYTCPGQVLVAVTSSSGVFYSSSPSVSMTAYGISMVT